MTLSPYPKNAYRVRSPLAVVAVDVDGVCADLMTVWLQRYNKEFNDTLTPDQITDWDISRFVKVHARTRIHELLHDRSLYDEVQPYPGAVEAVMALRALQCRVVFATTAASGHAGAKLHWLEHHGFLRSNHPYPHPDYIEITDKALLDVDVLIDDRWTTVREFRTRGSSEKRGLLMRSPANAWLPVVSHSWRTVIERIKAPLLDRPSIDRDEFLHLYSKVESAHGHPARRFEVIMVPLHGSNRRTDVALTHWARQQGYEVQPRYHQPISHLRLGYPGPAYRVPRLREFLTSLGTPLRDQFRCYLEEYALLKPVEHDPRIKFRVCDARRSERGGVFFRDLDAAAKCAEDHSLEEEAKARP